MFKYYATIRDHNGSDLYLSKMKTTETIYISRSKEFVQQFGTLKEVINFVLSYLSRLTYGNVETQLKYIRIRRDVLETTSDH